MEKQMRTAKPAKMFVYLPVYLIKKRPGRPPEEGFKPEYVRTVVKEMPISRIEVGDVFVAIKRDNVRDIMADKGLKVEQVKRSIVDRSCVVVLEKIVFEKEDELKEFLKNKRSLY